MGKKKDKPIYVDDGRTIADMSSVEQGASRYFRNDLPSVGSFRDKWSTFWTAFKMMLLPTLVMCLGLAAMYGLMYFLFYWM